MSQAQTTELKTPNPLQVVERFKSITSTKNWDRKNVSLFTESKQPKETRKGIILQVKMKYGFNYGLNSMLDEIKKLGISIDELKAGNYVAFVNTLQNKVRLVTIHPKLRGINGEPWIISTQAVAPKGHFLDLRIIKFLPQSFNGAALDLDKAASMALDAYFGQTKRKNTNIFAE